MLMNGKKNTFKCVKINESFTSIILCRINATVNTVVTTAIK